jgi:hypothetical protein
MNKTILFIIGFTLSLTFNLVAGSIKSKEVNALFKSSKITTYSVKDGGFWDDYEYVYIGYNTNKKAIMGITLQKIKETYKKINIVVAIIKKGDDYFVKDVIATNISIIKDKKQLKNVQTALASFKGKKVAPKDKNTVDAVTGATFCHRRIYKDINEIIHTSIKIMKDSKNLKKETFK